MNKYDSLSQTRPPYLSKASVIAIGDDLVNS